MNIKRQNIPLNGLRVFEAVARQQNMGRAAEELCVTHSAVSQQVRNLEEVLGAQLFDRKFKPLRLTVKGEQLQRTVVHGLNILLRGTDEIHFGEIEGELNVSCVPGLGANWFVHELGNFLKSYEKVHVQVFTDTWRHQVRTDNIDLEIVYGSAEHPGKRVTLLGHPEFFPVCSPQLLESQSAMQDASDLLSHTLLHEHSEQTWTRWFAAAGIENPKPNRNVMFDSAHLSLQASRAGHGIALADKAVVKNDLDRGRLIRLFELSIPASHPYYILTSPLDHCKPATIALETWVLEQYSAIDRR